MNNSEYIQISQLQIEEFILDALPSHLAEIVDQCTDIDYDYYTIDSLDELSFNVNYCNYAYVVQGRLLAEIAYKRLYKHRYSSFNAYCCNELHLTASRARQLMVASRVTLTLIAASHTKLPTNPSQACVLEKLSGDELVDGWEKLLEVYEIHEMTGKRIRAFLFPPESAQIESTTTSIPINPENLYRLTKLAFRLKLSIDDVVTLLLQNSKYYLLISLTLLRISFGKSTTENGNYRI